MIQRNYGYLGELFADLLRFPQMTKESMGKTIKVHHEERYLNTHAENKGVIVLTGHFGNWELLQFVSNVYYDYPVHLIAANQKHNKMKLRDPNNQAEEAVHAMLESPHVISFVMHGHPYWISNFPDAIFQAKKKGYAIGKKEEERGNKWGRTVHIAKWFLVNRKEALKKYQDEVRKIK